MMMRPVDAERWTVQLLALLLVLAFLFVFLLASIDPSVNYGGGGYVVVLMLQSILSQGLGVGLCLIFNETRPRAVVKKISVALQSILRQISGSH